MAYSSTQPRRHSAPWSEVSSLSENSTDPPGRHSIVSVYEDAPGSPMSLHPPARVRPSTPGPSRAQPTSSRAHRTPIRAPGQPLASRPLIESTYTEAGPSSKPLSPLPLTPNVSSALPSPLPPAHRAIRAGAAARKRENANKRAAKPRYKMFRLGQDSKLLGAGHVVLNVLRAFNMIGLAAAMVASMVMPVLSGINGHFYFFDMITHVFVFFFATFLFVSELPVPWRKLKGYYERNWPVLGPDHSLAWLGWGMVFIGFQILGDAWKPAYTVETIGLDWWRAILAAAILSVTFGFFNICASIIFRTSIDGLRGEVVKVTSRQIRTHGNLSLQNAANKNDDIEHSFSSHYSSPHRDNWSAQSWSKEEEAVGPSSAVKRLTRAFNPRNFNFRKSRIQISKPIPQNTADDVERGHSSHSRGDSFDDNLNGHGEDRGSPIMPGLQRPPTELHPAYMPKSRTSLYSAAHMDRF